MAGEREQMVYQDRGETKRVDFTLSETSEGELRGQILQVGPFNVHIIDKIVNGKYPRSHFDTYYILRGEHGSFLIDKLQVYQLDEEGKVVKEVGRWQNGYQDVTLGQEYTLEYDHAPIEGSGLFHELRRGLLLPGAYSSEKIKFTMGKLQSVEFFSTPARPLQSIKVFLDTN